MSWIILEIICRRWVLEFQTCSPVTSIHSWLYMRITYQIFANKEVTIFYLWWLLDMGTFYGRTSFKANITKKQFKLLNLPLIGFLLLLLSKQPKESLKMLNQIMSLKDLQCLSILIRIKVKVFTYLTRLHMLWSLRAQHLLLSPLLTLFLVYWPLCSSQNRSHTLHPKAITHILSRILFSK